MVELDDRVPRHRVRDREQLRGVGVHELLVGRSRRRAARCDRPAPDRRRRAAARWSARSTRSRRPMPSRCERRDLASRSPFDVVIGERRSPGCPPATCATTRCGFGIVESFEACAWTWRSAASVPCGVHARSSGIASSTLPRSAGQIDLALPALVLDAAPRPDLVAAVRDRRRRRARIGADRDLAGAVARGSRPSHDADRRRARSRTRRAPWRCAVEVERCRCGRGAPCASNSSTRAPTGIAAVGDAQHERRRRRRRPRRWLARGHASTRERAASGDARVIAAGTRRPR